MDIKELRKQILKQIEQLPPEQARVLRQQIEAMSDEELIAFIKRQQERQLQAEAGERQESHCFFCEVSAGRVDVVKVYEDQNFIAFLDAYPAAIGHILLISKEHQEFSKMQARMQEQMLSVARKIISAFYNIGFNGFNLIINEGISAGQNFEHASLHLIPRKNNDHVEFGWKKEQVSREKLEEIGKVIEEKIKVELKKEEQKKEEEIKKNAEERAKKILKFIKERKP